MRIVYLLVPALLSHPREPLKPAIGLKDGGQW